MAKGGARTGAGRKSKWSSSKTVNIRVPEYLATEVTAYAQQLDRQRVAELERRQLMTLLEELVHVPLAQRKQWIEALPETSRSSLKDAEGKTEPSRTEVKVQRLHRFDTEGDSEAVEVKFEVSDMQGDVPSLSAVSSLGHRWNIQKQNGKLIVDLPGIPEEALSLSVDDDGTIFLQVLRKWAVSCIVSQK